MILGQKCAFVAILVIYLLPLPSKCQGDTMVEETRLSVAEKSLKALTIPVNIAKDAASEIQSGVGQILGRIPGISSRDENLPSRLSDILNKYAGKFRAIYPGTHWCGAGDIAKNDDDLGLFDKTDACCRAHDKCSDIILTGTQSGNLKNNGLFTRSHCDCDTQFYNCLKKVRSVISEKIGHTYFNILSPQCFKKDYPIVRCEKRAGRINKKCVSYKLDPTKPERKQWFDNPIF